MLLLLLCSVEGVEKKCYYEAVEAKAFWRKTKAPFFNDKSACKVQRGASSDFEDGLFLRIRGECG